MSSMVNIITKQIKTLEMRSPLTSLGERKLAALHKKLAYYTRKMYKDQVIDVDFSE